MSGHTHTHTHTDTHTYTHDNYSNPRCAHAHRGLIIYTCSIFHVAGIIILDDNDYLLY